MSPVNTLLISMVILIIGINLAANNTLHSYIIGYIFFDDSMSNRILRFIGLMMLGSVVLLLVGMTSYAILVNLLCIMIFVFLAIRGRSKVQAIIKHKRTEAQNAYNEEIKRKKLEIAQIKQRKKNEFEEKKGKPQSISEMKKQMWNDGKMTNKEMIENLKK